MPVWSTLNLILEVAGCVAVASSVRKLLRSEHVAGICPWQVGLSCVWAVACVPYYAGHGEWTTSIVAGLRAALTLCWCGMAWYWKSTTPRPDWRAK